MEEWIIYLIIGAVAVVSKFIGQLNEASQDDAAVPEEGGESTDRPEHPIPPQTVDEELSGKELWDDLLRHLRGDQTPAREEHRTATAASDRTEHRPYSAASSREEGQVSDVRSLEMIPPPYENEPVSLETIEEEVPTVPSAAASHRSLSEPEPTEKPIGEEQQGSSPLAEFDLERAVIYSEVLRPKYKEYES